MCRSFALSFLFTIVVFLPLSPPALRAQVTPIRHQDSGFRYDNTFKFGVLGGGYDKTVPLIESLGIDFISNYGGLELASLDTTVSDWGIKMIHKFWVAVRKTRMKVVEDESFIHKLNGGESPVGAAWSNVNVYGFDGTDEVTHYARFDSTKTADSIDYLPTQWIWSGRFDPTSPGTLKTMVKGNRWSAIGIDTGSVDKSVVPGWVDNAYDADLQIRIKADIPADSSSGMVIAKAVLYVRDTIAQNAQTLRPGVAGDTLCQCGFYKPFDTVDITKGMYGAADGKYHDILATFRFPDTAVTVPAINIVIAPGDTVHAVSAGSSHSLRPSSSFWGYQAVQRNLSGSRQQKYCAKLYDSLRAHNIIPATTTDEIIPEHSDFYVNLYTTQKARIYFLRMRTGTHLLTSVEQGAYDAAIDSAVARVYRDTVLTGHDTLLMRINLGDEENTGRYELYRSFASKFSHAMIKRDPSGRIMTWSNPSQYPSTMRRQTGDIDSTTYKAVQIMSLQDYADAGNLPITYLNKKQMDSSCHMWDDRILGNNPAIAFSWSFIARSTDGGRNWQDTLIPGPEPLWSISFSDSRNGWAVGRITDFDFGSSSTLFRTTDGGASWSWRDYFGADRVVFVDSLNGWTARSLYFQGNVDTTEVDHSTDGGVTWHRQLSAIADHISGLSFTDVRNGTAVGSLGAIYRTTDGGNVWKAAATGESANLLAVSFSDTSNGWAVGVDQNLGFSGRKYATILHTTDGGLMWKGQPSGVWGALRSVSFSDSLTGWAVGDSGAILFSGDGGNTWETQHFDSNRTLYGVAAVNDTTVWVVGDSGTILHSSNGGKTWVGQLSGTTQYLYSISIVNSLIACSVGESGTIIRTEDGGATWFRQDPRTSAVLRSVFFLNSNSGWAAGDTIVATGNGGVGWLGTKLLQPINASAIWFTNAEQGWALTGDSSYILHSTNGGETWSYQLYARWNYLWGICFANSKIGWAVGKGGLVYRYGSSNYAGTETPHETAVPVSLELRSFPNPFNNSTTFRFALPDKMPVTLRVVGESGREVSRLVSRTLEQGTHEMQWDAGNEPSGVYFCELSAGTHSQTVRVVLVR